MADCDAELCEHWTGQGCVCAVLDIERPHRCDVCDLPDLHNGAGDGIGSCMCHRCECGQAEWSALCTCPPEDDWHDDEDGGGDG